MNPIPPLRTLSELKVAFKEHSIWARKEYGQNFLIDHNLLQFLVRSGAVSQDDLVLDIGAGTGLLTRRLAENAWKVWGVEIDPLMFDFCATHTAPLPNVRLFRQDVLKDKNHLDPELESAIQAELAANPGKSFKVVANLPYNISTLVIPDLLEGPLPVKVMVMTVQKEVGERLVAGPGTKEYGSLSVTVKANAFVEILRVLPNKVFWPRPNVDSAIVRILPNKYHSHKIMNYEWFKNVTRGLFSARRKMAVNALKGALGIGLSGEQVESAFHRQGLDPKSRAEQFSLETIISLSNELLLERGHP